MSSVLLWGSKDLLYLFRFFHFLLILCLNVISKTYWHLDATSKDLHSGELSDHTKFDEDVKVMSQQECLLKLQELKDEINQSWRAGDRVTSLRLSIKVNSCHNSSYFFLILCFTFFWIF